MEEEEEFQEQSLKWVFDNGILGFNGMQRKMVGFRLNPQICSSSLVFKPFGVLLFLISSLAALFLLLWV